MRFALDLLPPHAAVEADIAHHGKSVRFVAVQYGEDNITELARSLPSGWFPVTDEPVVLAWAAFEFEEQHGPH